MSHGILAPERQAYKALVLRSTDKLTVSGIKKLYEYAQAGLPIVIAGGDMPSYLTPFDKQGAKYVNQTLQSMSRLPNVHQISGQEVGATLSSIGVHPLTKINCNGKWYTHWRQESGSAYVLVYSDSDDGHSKSPTEYTSGTVEFACVGVPWMLDAWSGAETPILNYTRSDSSTTIHFTLATNQAVIVMFRDNQKPDVHAVSTDGNVLDIVSRASSLAAKVGYTAAAVIKTSNGRRHAVNGTSTKPWALQNWTLTAEHWEPPSDLAIGGTIKRNTTHQLNELVSWQNVAGLEHASGVGYYETEFMWSSSDDSGAYVNFGAVIQTLRVSVNGRQIPALDVTEAKADITEYLVRGRNTLRATVSTTLANAMAPVWKQLKTAGSPPSGLGGTDTTPPGNASYGLVEPVTLTPYRLAYLQ